MKKIVAMTVAFAMALSMSVFAVSANGDGVYEYRTGNVTIVFWRGYRAYGRAEAEHNKRCRRRKQLICCSTEEHYLLGFRS